MNTILLLLSCFFLAGCQLFSPSIKNRVSFEINNGYWPKNSIVYKNNWPECGNLSGSPDILKIQKYITTYNSCKISPEGYIPEQIIIEYAPWLTMKEVEEKLGNYPQKALSDIVLGFASEKQYTEFKTWYLRHEKLIEKTPITAWKRIVFTPSKEVKKYKYQVPEGKGNRARGKNIHYIISLHPDGSHSIETKLYWVEKYHTQWN